MDGHGWRLLYQTIRRSNKAVPFDGYRTPVFSDVLIVAMYFWSVWHDRPLCWACRRDNYGSLFRPRRLPSVSQFCKRIKTPRCHEMLQWVYGEVSACSELSSLWYVDGRPMPVGACSSDRDARAGRVQGGFARGYKLHAIINENGTIPIWKVTSLNVSEPCVAQELLAQLRPGGIGLGDGNYDSGDLYDEVARHGGMFITPLPDNAGEGHRKQSAARLLAIRVRGLSTYVYRQRIAAEQRLSQLSSFGGGLSPLPAWVRTLPRVRRWIGAKLVIYHVRRATRSTAV
jgi:hypothetical protein